MNTSSSRIIYDVAVIGGGIAGAGIARDAALRDLKIVLFEKNTFGSGTSSKSSKLIHGGIRYLETAWSELKKGRLTEARKNFCFVFTSLRESKLLRKIAPELVQPLPLLIPVLKNDGRALWEIFLGSWLYFFLSFLSGPAKLPKILWNKRALQKILPSIDLEKVRAGVVIWDHWTDDQALVKQTMLSAVRHGANALEHAEVVTYSFDPSNDHYEIKVRQNGSEQIYYSKKMINASGPWLDELRERGNEKTDDFIVPVAGCHLNFKKFIPHSVILQAKDGRIFFVINIGEISRVGTTERLCADPDSVEPTETEIEYLLENLKNYFPALRLDKSQIIGRDAGIRPLARPANEKTVHTISREHEVRIGPTGVIHVIGVKLTDHRRAAEKVINRLSKKRSLTQRTPLDV